jgi:hypothetical protein
VADVVDRLVRHATGQRSVADHRDDVAVRVGAQVARTAMPYAYESTVEAWLFSM